MSNGIHLGQHHLAVRSADLAHPVVQRPFFGRVLPIVSADGYLSSRTRIYGADMRKGGRADRLLDVIGYTGEVEQLDECVRCHPSLLGRRMALFEW
jgi:hypothetical protein